MVRLSSAISRLRVNIPCSPKAERGVFRSRSPSLLIGTRTAGTPSFSNSCCTCVACQMASWLSLVPILIGVCIALFRRGNIFVDRFYELTASLVMVAHFTGHAIDHPLDLLFGMHIVGDREWLTFQPAVYRTRMQFF